MDVLIVVARDVAITRSLYSPWDDLDLAIDGHRVEPHFVRMCGSGDAISGLWAEVALDGAVACDPELTLTRELARIRGAIIGGRLVRRLQNRDFACDYLRRSGIRLGALAVLYEAESWADVVRESQEIVEHTLKGLLRGCAVRPRRMHDVSDVLLAERERLPRELAGHMERMASVSRRLRRDRELAFYGAEDLTPSGFYTEEDARAARVDAEDLVALMAPHV